MITYHKKNPLLIALWIGLITSSSTVLADEWMDQLNQHRREKDRHFLKAPLSPMAASDRAVLKGIKAHFIGVEDGQVVVLEHQTKSALAKVESKGAGWYLEKLVPFSEVSRDGELVDSTRILSRMVFKSGDNRLLFYPSKEELTLILFDAGRPGSLHFKGLHYFPPNKDFAVQARIEKLPAPERVTMLTSRNLEKSYFRYAKLHFEIHGKRYHLYAYKFSLDGEYSEMLFIPFTDKTTGNQTYMVGRFLELNEPKEGPLNLDFNYAFNPLCNYSPGYNCPIPLQENELPLEVLAGEKVYPLEMH